MNSGELRDTHQIGLSEDAIEDAVRDYQRMLAARQQDLQVLAQEYAAGDQLSLTIDGSQPEKGHETLYVVRELTLKRVWFAEALVSSSAEDLTKNAGIMPVSETCGGTGIGRSRMTA
jgi:hypothetical protein